MWANYTTKADVILSYASSRRHALTTVSAQEAGEQFDALFD